MLKTIFFIGLFVTLSYGFCMDYKSCSSCNTDGDCCWDYDFGMCTLSVGSCASTSCSVTPTTNNNNNNNGGSTHFPSFHYVPRSVTILIVAVSCLFALIHLSVIVLSLVWWKTTEQRLREWEMYEQIQPNTLNEAIPPEMCQVAFDVLSRHDVDDMKWLGMSCVNIPAARIGLGMFIFIGPVLGLIVSIVAIILRLSFFAVAPMFFAVFCICVDVMLLLYAKLGGKRKPDVYVLTSTHAIIITSGGFGRGSAEVNRYPFNSVDPKMMAPEIRTFSGDKGSIIFSQVKKWVEEVEHHRGRAHKHMVNKTFDIGFHNIPRFSVCHNLFIELHSASRLANPIQVLPVQVSLEPNSINFQMGGNSFNMNF